MNKHILSISIGVAFLTLFIYLNEPWIGLIAIAGPALAFLLGKLGVSGSGIFSALSLNGRLPIVAVLGFLIALGVAAYAFLLP